MTEQFASRANLLAGYAQQKGISFQEEADRLPKGDYLALVGLLAHRLGIPLAVAIDESLSKETLHKLSNN